MQAIHDFISEQTLIREHSHWDHCTTRKFINFILLHLTPGSMEIGLARGQILMAFVLLLFFIFQLKPMTVDLLCIW